MLVSTITELEKNLNFELLKSIIFIDFGGQISCQKFWNIAV